MKRIRLTHGQFALVDDEDFERINAHKWQAQWVPKQGSFRAVRNSCGERVLMHREVMRASPGEEVDHRFHDTLDNRKEKIRVCTRSQNKQNSRRYSRNLAGLKGVDKFKNRWRARIHVDSKTECLGFFDLRTEAALAYDVAAAAKFGEFACPNFAPTDADLLRRMVCKLKMNRSAMSSELTRDAGADQRVWAEHMAELETIIDRSATEMSRNERPSVTCYM
jgi:hypothetical protein